MPVAKTYQKFEIIGSPYLVKGKQYIKVRDSKGNVKQCRWYTEKEYAKMYGEPVPEGCNKQFSQKEALGFQNGYITIFKGDTYSHLDWFRQSIARYTRFWGWYIVSTDAIPEDVPEDLTSVQLPWDSVGTDSGDLKSETEIKGIIDSLIYEPSPSEYQGNIGEMIERTLTVKKNIPLDGAYGTSFMHVFTDEDENVYVWTTKAKNWAVDSVHYIKGKVKGHKLYQNTQQTVINYVKEI
jgi:hypothetical protein